MTDRQDAEAWVREYLTAEAPVCTDDDAVAIVHGVLQTIGYTDQPKWNPDWCCHPGETLLEALDDRGWRQSDLVDMTGFTAKHINQVIKGHAHIGVDFALALEAALGISAQMWMNLQTQWDIAQARGRSAAALAAEEDK